MGLRSWLRDNRAKAAERRYWLGLNTDQEVISVQVPELAGMSDVEGMAYVLDQITKWNKTCTPEQSAELSRRLLSSQASWEVEGGTMPYWGNLWALRTYQASLGLIVPAVAPPVQ
jgi:hypothetical protein